MPTRETRVTADGAQLAATLTLPPPAAGAVPVVVVAHGASEPTRDAFLYEHVADTASSLGMACLRYDRRGEGESTGSTTGVTPQVLADDLSAAVAAVRNDPDVASDRVVLWGHSQGAWLAALIAARDPGLRGLLAVSGSGSGPDEQMQYAVERIMREAHFTDDDVERALAARRIVTRWARNEMPHDVATVALAAANGEPWADLAFLPDALDPQDRPARRAWLEFDIVPALRRIEQPVLLVYGQRDRWIDAERSLAIWRSEVASADVMTLVLPECGHKPTLPRDASDWDEAGTVHRRYDDVLRTWLHRHG